VVGEKGRGGKENQVSKTEGTKTSGKKTLIQKKTSRTRINKGGEGFLKTRSRKIKMDWNVV